MSSHILAGWARTTRCQACTPRLIEYGGGMREMTVRTVYDMWPQYDRRLREVIGALSAEQLAIRPSPQRWPIWATVGHTAAGRVYWLCHVIGEPGSESTPFDATWEDGWEDNLDHPRGADELVGALDSTSRIVERGLDDWALDMLADPFERQINGTTQVHTRGSILQRLFTHDAYHCGELSQSLGING